MAEPQNSSVFEYNNNLKIVTIMNWIISTTPLVDYYDKGLPQLPQVFPQKDGVMVVHINRLTPEYFLFN